MTRLTFSKQCILFAERFSIVEGKGSAGRGRKGINSPSKRGRKGDQNVPLLPLTPLPTDIKHLQRRPPNLEDLLLHSNGSNSGSEDVVVGGDVARGAGSGHGVEEAAQGERERQGRQEEGKREEEKRRRGEKSVKKVFLAQGKVTRRTIERSCTGEVKRGVSKGSEKPKQKERRR
jgi:hypothetical protein